MWTVSSTAHCNKSNSKIHHVKPFIKKAGFNPIKPASQASLKKPGFLNPDQTLGKHTAK